MTLLAHGCPVQAIVAAFGLDERTVRAWLAKSGAHGQAMHEHLVEQPQDLGQVQYDESCVKAQRGIRWLARGTVCPATFVAGRGNQSTPRWPADRMFNPTRQTLRLGTGWADALLKRVPEGEQGGEHRPKCG